MKRIWLTVLLLCFAAIGFADAPSPSDISNLPGAGLIPMGTIPGTDMSMKYLSQLFGSVGGVLQSTANVQLLPELFGIFNKAILALALAWTSYTIITIMFNSAMEGGFITSQRKNAVYIFARLAIGFSLLLPLSSGYSALQVIGMRAMVEGVNLANKVWDETIYFITEKGILHNYSEKSAAVNSSATVGPKGWNGKATLYSPSNQKSATGTQALMYDMLCTAYYAASSPGSNASKGPIYIPSAGATDPLQYFNFPDDKTDNGCGTYRLDNADTNQNTAQGLIDQTMVYDMWPVAQTVITQFGIGPNGVVNPVSNPNSALSSAADTLSDILNNYVASAILNITNHASFNKNSVTTDTSWEVQAADQGWLGAGRFYWLLSEANWNNVQNQGASTNTSANVTWPNITSATGASNMAANSVVLPANVDWNKPQTTGPTDIKDTFNTSIIPGTQAMIDSASAPFSSDPAGLKTYNGNGLCVDSASVGSGLPGSFVAGDITNQVDKSFDNKSYDNIPNGGNSTTSKYYLISDVSGATLSSLGSSGVAMGVCGQTNSIDNHTYDVPVLVKYASGTFGTRTEVQVNSLSPDDPGAYAYTVDNDASAAQYQDIGKLYPGVRLCPEVSFASGINPKDLLDEVGYCDSKTGKYGVTSSISYYTAYNPTFKSGAYGITQVPAIPTALETVASKFATLETDGNEGLTDPIYFMTQLGATMLGAAGTLWEQGADQLSSMAAWQGLFSGIAPGSTIFQGFISWWEPVYIAVGGGLFVAGFMLCFYAPLYPFILFLLGALNWLMVCVEFMVALPLVALGVTHPEGHDFLGKAEIALMLTLSACLRPVLMVLGFMAGMLMSLIGFSAVNYMFSSVLVFVFGNMPVNAGARSSTPSDYYQNTPAVVNSIFGVVTDDWTGKTDQSNVFTGSETTDMLLIPLLMVFYGYIVVEVVHFCFTMIHQLPDQVLRWIGGPVGQDRTQGIADKIRQGVQGAAKQAGDMQGKSVTSGGKAEGGAIGGAAGAILQVGVGAGKMMLG